MPIDMQNAVYWSVFHSVWLMYAFKSYLCLRQRRVYQQTTHLPAKYEKLMDNETFTKSRLYNLDKMNFSLIHELYGILQMLLFLHYNLFALVWQECASWMTNWGYDPVDYEIRTSLLFIFVLTIFNTVDDLPWSVYSHFVLEERHGFNKLTWGFFVKDKIKSFLLSIVLTLPIVAAIIAIIQWGGPYFYIYVWAFVFTVSLVLLLVYHDFIAPLFDRYEPLPEGELKQEIEQICASIDFPLKKLFVVEGSKRSAHSNAYFYGFWKQKRIVLFDTLIEGFVMPGKNTTGSESDNSTTTGDVAPTADPPQQEHVKKCKGCKTPEILAVLGHELGHWQYGHMLYNIVISQVNLFVLFFLFGQLLHVNGVYAAFGFAANTAPLIMRLIIVVQLVLLPLNTVMHFFVIWLSRKFEFQADRFATVQMKRGKELQSGLIKLGVDNLSFPICDPYYSAFNFSHPPAIERIEVIDGLLTKSK